MRVRDATASSDTRMDYGHGAYWETDGGVMPARALPRTGPTLRAEVYNMYTTSV